MRISNASDLDAYDALPLRDRQIACDELSSDDRKRMQELRAFLGFAKASSLPVDPSTVVCLDPPYPDLRCTINSSPYLFELGEVTDEGLARGYSDSLKTGRVTVGWYSQDEPLSSILTLKAQKTYQTDGHPVDLVLYYWKQAPFEPVVQRVLFELRPMIGAMLSPGRFSKIWIYEHTDPPRVLWELSA
jgi:hypothetical protein